MSSPPPLSRICIYFPPSMPFWSAKSLERKNALSHSLYLLVFDWCWCVRASQRMEDGQLIISEGLSGEFWHPQLLFTLWALRTHQAEPPCHLRIHLLTKQIKMLLFIQSYTLQCWLYGIINSLPVVLVNPSNYTWLLSPGTLVSRVSSCLWEVPTLSCRGTIFSQKVFIGEIIGWIANV